jgi:SsrA-binding protein
MAKDKNSAALAVNKQARFNYQIEEHLECGIELKGTEVKSIRARKFSFSDAYGRIRDGELWLIGLHISEYSHGGIENHDPDRDRKLLVHKQELKRLKRRVEEKGYTLVPLNLHMKKDLIKVEMGLGKGKRQYDKRQEIKKKDQKRDIEREFRGRF